MSALTGLVGVVLGILLGKFLERLLDILRRREREIDMVVALHAEISAGRTAASDQGEGPNAAYMVENDFPAGPSDRTDFVFEALKLDLSILPQRVIHQVVLYYRLAEQSNLMVEFLWTDLYARQNDDERRRFRENLLAGLRDQEMAADAALTALEAFMRMSALERMSQKTTTLPSRSRTRSDERADGADHR